MRSSLCGSCLATLLALFACGGDAGSPGSPTEPLPPPSIPAEATAWLNANTVPFDGTGLTLPHRDLEFLRALVGNARIVALGENTHGTRDFFEMKARVLRFLVEEMGFDAFAIEATWPESYRLDRYVRTGEGDPVELLSGLYFWTWNTESVLEMIRWMRAHNQAGGRVGFYGFDMQYPGMAIDNVLRYFAEVDSAALRQARDDVNCLARYANGPSGQFPNPGYRDQTSAYRGTCRQQLLAVRNRMIAFRSAYEAASSPAAFAFALQSLRVAEQYAQMISAEQTRDHSMAENTIWLADQLGPQSRLVLWAHNFHVSTMTGAQGSWLRQAYGDRMVIIGFSHAAGRFTARTQSGNTIAGLAEHTLDPPAPLSYEHYFSTAASPRFVLDLRRPALPAWLATSRTFRSIGCCFDPANPTRYWFATILPNDFDVIIHFQQTGPTTVLPYRPPSTF